VIKGMLNILFPKYCPGCGHVLDQPKILLCPKCRNALPLTHYHKYNNQSIVDKFYGILALDQGTALLHYHKKGLAQKLIHALKYRGNKNIGYWLGTWLGQELKAIESYRHISGVVPVPMHPKKLRLRGYNQAAVFGRALAEAMAIPFIETLLIQTEMSDTQAKLGRWDRWAKKNSFALNGSHQDIIKNILFNSTALESKPRESIVQLLNHEKHSAKDPCRTINLLLVDDVITTGATIEACGRILTNELGASLSCASIAIA
jgi:predicted amidophosphoribosyltransferase